MRQGPELCLLNDGVVRQDPGGPFGLVPAALWERSFPEEAWSKVPLVLWSLLVRSEGKTILVDTGLGTKLDEAALGQWDLERPEGGLLEGLHRLGTSPEDVDLVINTHLHADHCGGNTRIEAGSLVPSFPRAEYWVQRLEWAQASLPDERTRHTYSPVNFLPLVREGRMRLLHGDTPATHEVRCVVTRGHTRGHQSVLVEGLASPVFFTGDLASLAVHFAHLSWLTAYDVEPLETLRSKQRWQAWSVECGARVICAHEKYQPVFQVEQADSELRLRPAARPGG
jgi:glyoxylase-like metal-dependent hydrolase (beta-lactamase superfamily II)